MSEHQSASPFPPNASFEPALVDRPPVVPKPKLSYEANPYRNEPRVWITLERSDRIPPTGQFFGYCAEVLQADGVSKHKIAREFILKPGEKAWVPQGLLDVLNNAVESVPVKDAEDRVTHYEDRLRFSYRIHNDPPPEGWVQPAELVKEAA
jgi:hypothetical protein